MTRDEAIQVIKNTPINIGRQNGKHLIQEAMNMAIEALEDNDKLAEDLQSCLEMYKKKKAEVKALERQHGKWEFYSRDEDAFDVYGNESWAIRYYCSNCNFMHAFIENHTAQYNFCPNCGADMRGEE